MTNDQIAAIVVPAIAAIGGGIVGALLASKAQKKLIRRNDKKFILAQLMGFRHLGSLADEFVTALNMIVVVWHDNTPIKQSLHRYLTATGSGQMFTAGQRLDALFALLNLMAEDLGYSLLHDDFNDFFSPERPTQQPPSNPDQPKQ